MTSDGKLVWRADELARASFRFVHPLDEDAQITLTPLSRISRLARAGVNLVRIPPGRRAFPMHRHQVEEEWVYIISGTAEIRLDGARHRLGAGGFAAFPPAGPVHAVENVSSDEDLVCLTGGECAAADIIDFPEAGRRVARGRSSVESAAADAFEPFDFFSRTPPPERAA